MRSGRTQLHGGRPASCNKFSRLSPYPMKGLTNFQKAGLDKYLAGYFKQNKCVTRTKKNWRYMCETEYGYIYFFEFSN